MYVVYYILYIYYTLSFTGHVQTLQSPTFKFYESARVMSTWTTHKGHCPALIVESNSFLLF